jgi:hypothetical protein
VVTEKSYNQSLGKVIQVWTHCFIILLHLITWLSLSLCLCLQCEMWAHMKWDVVFHCPIAWSCQVIQSHSHFGRNQKHLWSVGGMKFHSSQSTTHTHTSLTLLCDFTGYLWFQLWIPSSTGG